ncbi:thiol-disulfide oxidoreductase DCC family protein [Pseudomonas sp. Marseille-QA0892]
MSDQDMFPLTLYVDMDCPLCAREINWLAPKADPSRLRFVDVSAPDFDERSAGRSREALNERLHARTADGRWLTGIDATLWSWRAAGHGRWAAPLGWMPLRPLFHVAYSIFARLRPRFGWLPHPEGARRCLDNCTVPPPTEIKSQPSPAGERYQGKRSPE